MTKLTKKDREWLHRREAWGCIVVAILGWVWLPIVFFPIVLWRSIYVIIATKNANTAIIALVGALIAGLGALVLAVQVAIVWLLYTGGGA